MVPGSVQHTQRLLPVAGCGDVAVPGADGSQGVPHGLHRVPAQRTHFQRQAVAADDGRLSTSVLARVSHLGLPGLPCVQCGRVCHYIPGGYEHAVHCR